LAQLAHRAGIEIKFDGYRMHARLDRDAMRLLTRIGLYWTQKYPESAARNSYCRCSEDSGACCRRRALGDANSQYPLGGESQCTIIDVAGGRTRSIGGGLSAR
jgi:hypothetical protein